MALDHLHLQVAWPSGRQVSVDVLVLPEFNPSRAFDRGVAKAGPSEEIGPDDLESLPALHEFLTRVTRSADAGEVRRVSCQRTREEQLLELLGVEGPPPDPIAISLPDDG
jgi:hypothetical protein